MRGRAVKWAWLTASALCTALLFACAGENAVQTFRAQQRTEEAAGVEESRQLSGYVIALDAGHGGYDAMNEKLSPKKTRTALGGDYYILTLGVPSVLVECGFLSNAKEEALLLTEDSRQRVAQAIASGVWAWANLPEEKPQALPAVDRSGEPHAET